MCEEIRNEPKRTWKTTNAVSGDSLPQCWHAATHAGSKASSGEYIMRILRRNQPKLMWQARPSSPSSRTKTPNKLIQVKLGSSNWHVKSQARSKLHVYINIYIYMYILTHRTVYNSKCIQWKTTESWQSRDISSHMGPNKSMKINCWHDPKRAGRGRVPCHASPQKDSKV